MKKSLLSIFLLTSLPMVTVGCNGNKHDSGKMSSVAVKGIAELPLPVVPDSILTPEGRVAFALPRFWDAMDFSDKSQSLDTVFMEQNFANFASLFELADSAVMTQSVANLMVKAEKTPEAADFIRAIAEKYLHDSDSPMRDEESFIYFLRWDISSKSLTEEAKERSRLLLEDAMKNRQGSQASDFNVITREDDRSSMLSLAKRDGKRTLLIFYDPDCESCSAILGQLSSVALPSDVKVIAVDAEDNRKRWEETKNEMPAHWTVAYSLSPIVENEIYLLPAMPTIYLLDKEGIILLKDPTPEKLVRYLHFH